MHNLFQEGLFFILASIAVFSAIMVILFDNPVRCALSLVVTFIASSGLWILAHAEFLGLILVLVYVGAVMTLFLFVVMMLDTEKLSGKRYLLRYLPFAVMVVGLLVLLMWVAIKPESFGHLANVTNAVENVSNTESLGLVLYTVYAYPLEMAAILLLIAIISAIVLAHRPTKLNTKTQKISTQLAASKANRLRIVKIASNPTKE